jgi:hypothetical protein
MSLDIRLAGPTDDVLTARDDQGQQVLSLRREGFSTAEIAAKLNMTTLKVTRLLRRAVGDYLDPDLPTLRAIEATKLDALEEVIKAKVQDGNLPAMDRALKIMDARARLFGLYPKPETETSKDQQNPEGPRVLDVQVWKPPDPDSATAEDPSVPASGQGVEE